MTVGSEPDPSAGWDDPPDWTPEPVVRAPDPVAVAVGNASLLGIGYALMGRKALFLLTALVTVALVVLQAVEVRAAWLEFVIVGWWVLVIAHGWFLAGGRLRRPRSERPWQRRLAALAVTLPVLLLVGLTRVDTEGIDQDIADARRDGDCGRALAAVGRVSGEHRVVNGPMTVRADTTNDACLRLRMAFGELTTGLTGDTIGLSAGFGRLLAVRTELPGHEPMVDAVLAGFVDRLPTQDACATAKIADWLLAKKARSDLVDRAAKVVPDIAPAAILACGDTLFDTSQWEQARGRYQQLLDDYPEHELTTEAEEGVKQANLAIELDTLRGRLTGGTATTQPEYCTNPAKYGGAPAYRPKKLNRALVFGNDYGTRLPADWLANGADDAVLVICAGESKFGATVETCPYVPEQGPYRVVSVSFHKIAIRVRVFEVRTGKLVKDTTVQIGGGGCPERFTYTYFGDNDNPPTQRYVTEADSDVHAAFKPIITP